MSKIITFFKKINSMMLTKKYVIIGIFSTISLFLLFFILYALYPEKIWVNWLCLILFIVSMIDYALTFFYGLRLMDKWDKKRAEKKRKQKYPKAAYWLRQRKFNDQFVVRDILNYYGFSTKNGDVKFDDLTQNSIEDNDFDKVLIYKETIKKRINTEKEIEIFFIQKKMLKVNYKKIYSFKSIYTVIITIVGLPAVKSFFIRLTVWDKLFDISNSNDEIKGFFSIVALYSIIILLVYCLYMVIKNKDMIQRRNLLFIFDLAEKEICHTTTTK